MKFKTILLLLEQEKSKRRKNKTPAAAQSIKQAYTRIIKNIEDSFDENEQVTAEKLNTIDATDHMRQKMTNWLVNDKKPKEVKGSAVLRAELVKFMGIGDKVAKRLIKLGVKSIRDLYHKKYYSTLPEVTQVFLKMKPDTKIPYRYIQQFDQWLQSEYKGDAMIVGSYRRKTKYSADVDIILTDESEDVLSRFMDFLKQKFPRTSVYATGESKINLVVDLSPLGEDLDNEVVKLDLFWAKPEYKIPMIFYGTGNRALNILVRSALKKGILQSDGSKRYFTLNQYGVFEKTSNGLKLILVESEQDIFKLAGMDYLEPEDRSL